MSSDPVAIQTEKSDRSTTTPTCRRYQSRTARLRVVKYICRELKQAEHFEDDNDNDNDSDDVEDVSVHGLCITRRYRRRQARFFFSTLRGAGVIMNDLW
jgi:hypothetical protein